MLSSPRWMPPLMMCRLLTKSAGELLNFIWLHTGLNEAVWLWHVKTFGALMSIFFHFEHHPLKLLLTCDDISLQSRLHQSFVSSSWTHRHTTLRWVIVWNLRNHHKHIFFPPPPSFPTIYFSPAGRKTSPKKYEVRSWLMRKTLYVHMCLSVNRRHLYSREVARSQTSSPTWRGRPPTHWWCRRSPRRRRRRRTTMMRSQSYKGSKQELGSPSWGGESHAEKELNYIPLLVNYRMLWSRVERRGPPFRSSAALGKRWKVRRWWPGLPRFKIKSQFLGKRGTAFAKSRF